MQHLFLAAAALTAVSATGATAQTSTTATGVMPVAATVASGCIVVPQALAFGIVNQVNGTAADSQTYLTVTCTPGIHFDVGMDLGVNSSGSTRYMKSATTAALIPYGIFSNSTRTTAWGSTVGTDTVSGSATATPSRFDVYGRIPGSAAKVAAGLYADTVTVTVTF